MTVPPNDSGFVIVGFDDSKPDWLAERFADWLAERFADWLAERFAISG